MHIVHLVLLFIYVQFVYFIFYISYNAYIVIKTNKNQNIKIHTNIYIYLYCYLLLFYFVGVRSFHPGMYDVFTYNHMDLKYLRSRSHINASMVLTRADHLVIHNYIRSLLNITLRPIVMVRTMLKPVSNCLCI